MEQKKTLSLPQNVVFSQHDTAERKSQVSLMEGVDGDASEVVIWLDEEDLEIWDTVDPVTKISQAARVRCNERDFAYGRGVGFFGYRDTGLQAIDLPCVEEQQEEHADVIV